MDNHSERDVRQQRDPRILVVDDDKAVRYLCTEALKEYGTLEAENGREALALLAAHPVDVILTDVMMPEMNGLALLAAVKEQQPNRIVVVMTSFGDRDTVLQALRSDADDFIDKPIDVLQVRTVVERSLEKKQLREELIRLKQMDKLKSEFLGLISHKLKTPITVISLATQILAERSEGRSDDDFHKNVGTIQEQADYLVSLIEELLHFCDTILQEGQPQLTRTNLKHVIDDALEEVRDDASRQGVAVEVLPGSPLPPLMLDHTRIRFALHALLDNAVKFTPEGGKVTIEGAVEEKDVRITVADTGVGIAPEELAKVFEKFYQIDPDYTGQVRGFGLGLFYARRFIEDQGGSLVLTSTPGGGTSATISLPIP